MENKMTPKQALEKIKTQPINVGNEKSTLGKEFDYSFKIIDQALTEYEKQTQILEVLKNKGVDIDYLNYCIQFCKKHKEKIIRAFVYYNQTSPNRLKLTEEEFNLIKEWLK